MSTLLDAMLNAGLTHAPRNPQAGVINRFPGAGKPASNRAAWLFLFEDGQGAVFGDYSQGWQEIWQAERETPLTADERRAMMQAADKARRERQAEREATYRAASELAERDWLGSYLESGFHEYLQSKRIKPHGVRRFGHALAVPVRDIDGNLTSLQTIAPNGSKRFFSGGKVKGGMFIIGTPSNENTIQICEGYATGATLFEETGNPTICAFNAGNLMPVAIAVCGKWPSAEIIICGDDDRLAETNTGRTKANEAAAACGGLVAFPSFPDNAPESLSDFNDLACWLGGREVVV